MSGVPSILTSLDPSQDTNKYPGTDPSYCPSEILSNKSSGFFSKEPIK